MILYLHTYVILCTYVRTYVILFAVIILCMYIHNKHTIFCSSNNYVYVHDMYVQYVLYSGLGQLASASNPTSVCIHSYTPWRGRRCSPTGPCSSPLATPNQLARPYLPAWWRNPPVRYTLCVHVVCSMYSSFMHACVRIVHVRTYIYVHAIHMTVCISHICMYMYICTCCT